MKIELTDCDGDNLEIDGVFMSVTQGDNPNCFLVSKLDAIKIINHLKKVYDLPIQFLKGE